MLKVDFLKLSDSFLKFVNFGVGSIYLDFNLRQKWSSLLFNYLFLADHLYLQMLNQCDKIMHFLLRIWGNRQVVLIKFRFLLMPSPLRDFGGDVIFDPPPLETGEGVIVIFGEVSEGAGWCCCYPQGRLIVLIQELLMLIHIFQVLEVLNLLVELLKSNEIRNFL